MTATVRVLVALDVPAEQATDRDDLIASIRARVADEAGYLDSGDPVAPTAVTVAIVSDTDPITPTMLQGAYEVGIEGAADAEPAPIKECAFCGRPLPEGRAVYCDRICGIRDKADDDD